MNLLDAREWNSEKEVCTVIWEDEQVRIEKIVSYGQATPPDRMYCQREAEWVSVLHGQGTLYFPDSGHRSDARIRRLQNDSGRGAPYGDVYFKAMYMAVCV